MTAAADDGLVPDVALGVVAVDSRGVGGADVRFAVGDFKVVRFGGKDVVVVRDCGNVALAPVMIACVFVFAWVMPLLDDTAVTSGDVFAATVWDFETVSGRMGSSNRGGGAKSAMITGLVIGFVLGGMVVAFDIFGFTVGDIAVIVAWK